MTYDEAIALNASLRADQPILRAIAEGTYQIGDPRDVWSLLRSRCVIFNASGNLTLTRAGKARMVASLNTWIE